MPKAQYTGNNSAADEILRASDPVKMKKLGDAIKNETWIKTGEAKRHTEAIVASKFSQCRSVSRQSWHWLPPEQGN